MNATKLLTLSRLPPVSSAAAEAVAEMGLRRRGLVEPREVLVAPFGRIVLRCIDIGVPAPARSDCEAWNVLRVSGSEPPGTLILDNLTALRLTHTSLGLPAPRTFRRLGQMERGIVAATLAAVVRCFSNKLTLSLEPSGQPRPDLVRLTIAMEFDRFSEHVHLLVPPRWFPVDENRPIAEEALRRGLELSVSVEFAHTELATTDWAGAAAGDAVVFDDVAYPADGGPWDVQLVCGSHAARARWSSDGSLALASPFELRPVTSGRPSRPTSLSPGRSSMSTSSKDASSRTQAVIAAAPVEVVAEIGRVLLRAEEVLALEAGSVLALAPLQPELVALRVGSRTWARGELVDVEGRLGVRLTRIVSDGS